MTSQHTSKNYIGNIFIFKMLIVIYIKYYRIMIKYYSRLFSIILSLIYQTMKF